LFRWAFNTASTAASRARLAPQEAGSSLRPRVVLTSVRTSPPQTRSSRARAGSSGRFLRPRFGRRAQPKFWRQSGARATRPGFGSSSPIRRWIAMFRSRQHPFRAN
jgi:hypothetical protein